MSGGQSGARGGEQSGARGGGQSGPTGGWHIVLIGPPGAGKSTVGVELARRLGVRFTDTDTLVEQTAGVPVSDIFITDGEAHFRELEAAAVAQALAAPDPAVVALGGGAVMDPATRPRLAGHTVVYLQVSWDVAARRVGLNQARPLLIGNPRAQWRALMDQRRPVYEQLATLTVTTDDAEPAAVVERILAVLPSPPPGTPSRAGGPGAGEPR